jgi:signal transduction histidine kinase
MRLPVLANINRRTVAIATGTNEVLLDYAFIRAVDRLHYEKKLLSAKHHADDMAEQLRELAADLEQMVAQRTAELMSANRDLDSFAYTVSHDLRAPLRAVNGYCDVLLEDAGPRLDPTSQGYVGQIQRAVTSMNAMIDGLLQLSMGARAELQIQDVDLSRLARQIYQELQQAQPARRVICQIQEQLTARGDARLLEVVLRNLIGNAWKYSARAAQPTICFSAQDVDGVRQYCVTDNGVGFDMTQSDKLFQVFTRLPGVSDFPGIGIGLATVQRIIERHDGKVSARSIPGEGAEFFFTLPVAAVADGANVRSK